MKRINNYILEKFKINSKNAKYNFNYTKIINSIAKHFGFTKDEEVVEVIEKWVTDNDINQIFYYGDQEVLDEAENMGMSEKIMKDFDTSSEAIMNCMDAFEDYDELYSDEYNFSICANETILAFFGDNGNLYASKKKF